MILSTIVGSSSSAIRVFGLCWAYAFNAKNIDNVNNNFFIDSVLFNAKISFLSKFETK
jgi:hypothetical protein